MPAVHLVVEPAHGGGVEAAGQKAEGFGQSPMLAERARVRHGHGVVGREIAPIVLEDHEVLGGDEAVRRAAHHEVHLALGEGLVEKTQVHLARREAKPEAVGGQEAAHPVLAFEELAEKAHADRGGMRGEIRDPGDVPRGGVGPAHDQGEGVVETQGIADLEARGGVAGADREKHRGRV